MCNTCRVILEEFTFYAQKDHKYSTHCESGAKKKTTTGTGTLHFSIFFQSALHEDEDKKLKLCSGLVGYSTALYCTPPEYCTVTVACFSIFHACTVPSSTPPEPVSWLRSRTFLVSPALLRIVQFAGNLTDGRRTAPAVMIAAASGSTLSELLPLLLLPLLLLL